MRPFALALLTLAAVPASAEAHSVVRVGGTTVNYLSVDATSLNTLNVRMTGSRIEFDDRTVDGGIDPGTCDPGAISDDANAWIVEVLCPRGGIGSVRIDLGEREDRATVDLAMPMTLLGGPGSDVLRTGPGKHEVRGDEGNDDVTTGTGDDVVDGGLGHDILRSGEGDDEVRAADGLLDRIDCGPGRDRVIADTLDDAAIDCEIVERRAVVPPPDGGGETSDRTGPHVEAGGKTLQRLGRRTVKLLVTSSERGFLAASGRLDVSGISFPLQSDRRPVMVGGGGVRLTVDLRTRHVRLCRRALRRGRRCTLRMWAVGTDLAGNSTRARSVRIRLRA
jgi:Ca2+-binding RTX toxin-like protein